MPELKNFLQSEYDLYYLNRPNSTETIRILEEFSPKYWICNPSPGYVIDKKFMVNSLNAIITPSTGTNHINLIDAELSGISIFSISNREDFYSIKASSEFTFLLMAMMFRKIKLVAQIEKLGLWRSNVEDLRGKELFGKRVGILGLGRNGSNLAKFCSTFGMHVSYCDPNVSKESNFYRKFDDLSDMIRQVDALILTVELNSSTTNIIGENEFNLMKDGFVFVNTSRGELINQDDLIREVKRNRILIALDVLASEQSFNATSLEIIDLSKSQENLFVTPHIAGLTYDSEEKAQKIAISILKELSDNL